ncbi:MAG: C45 family autoproteolytic acyltransferase/hydrolase [Flavobacteriaceae bacterium]
MMNFQVIKYFKIVLIALVLVSCGVSKSIHHKPIIEGYNNTISEKVRHSDSLITIDGNFLRESKYGHWQLLAKGDPLERGLIIGSLTQDLLQYQDRVFFEKISNIIPSKFKQRLLRGFLKWFNRKLYLNVKEEYKTEIYGLSRYASDRYNYIAPKYLRSLYLHGAHDIGHALQDLALVGCSSFAAWGNKTQDGKLILGRNFDFYAGDEFAKNKLISFIKPDEGIPFVSVSWAGMIGTVSAMNLKGLTVTLNAGKSDVPLVAKTPISLVAREIIQYASTIDEAIQIAKTRTVFVAESIMVGSAADNKAVLIEVSPNNFGVYDVANNNQLLCANHFQSAAYKDDDKNTKQILESHSKYRFDKMTELFEKSIKITPEIAVEMLRNKEGLNGKRIGYGNEKALNQLLAHHGVVFKPSEKLIWVSSNPYQLGAFVAYDLDDVFDESFNKNSVFETTDLTIAADPFVNSKELLQYEVYRNLDRTIDTLLDDKNKTLHSDKLNSYIALNPDLWVPYYKVGKYYYQKKWFTKAKYYFKAALEKEVTTVPDLKLIKKYLKKCENKTD